MVLFIRCLCLGLCLFGMQAIAQDSVEKAPVVDPIKDLPLDLLKEIDEQKISDLNAKLGRISKRLDRDGMTMLHDLTIMRTHSLERTRELNRLLGIGPIRKAFEFLDKPEIKTELKAMNQMTPAKREVAYVQFLEKYNLEDADVQSAIEVKTIRKSIKENDEFVKLIEKNYDEYSAQVGKIITSGPRSRPGAMSKESLDEIRNRYPAQQAVKVAPKLVTGKAPIFPID